MDWKLFTSTATLIFLAELPDKTALAVLLMSSRYNPKSVLIGVCLAFAVQSVIAVSFGSLFGLLPPSAVHIGAAVLFFIFAALMWFKKEEKEDGVERKNQGQGFLRGLFSSFLAIFVAEWGDLTQLATATLQARYHKPLIIFSAATLALWATTAIFVFIGHTTKKFLNPRLLQKVGAVAFASAGLWMLWQLSKL